MNQGFDLSDLDTVDESRMTVIANGRPTDWVWVFAGPGHPKTVEQSKRMSRDLLQRERDQEQARANGRKWKAPNESPDETMERNTAHIVNRLLDWYCVDQDGKRTDRPVTMRGEPYPFSAENAKALLLDPRKSALLIQALEFLADEAVFTRRSATA